MKRTKTLSFKLTLLFLVFLLAVLGGCGALTYLNQMAIYRQRCETDARNVGEYLQNIIAADGDEFVRYQAYYLEHYSEIDLPVDAADYTPYRTAYERLFHATYPGMTLGVDITFDELSDDVKRAYLMYRHLYWLTTFEQARKDFDLTYTYYLVPHSDKDTVVYMLDCVRTSRAEHIEMIAQMPIYGKYDHPQGDEAEYLYLGDEVFNDREKYSVEWTAWESDEKQTGFQIWNNNFGNTYAYYTPLAINGQKIGMIGTEVDIESVNSAILHNTIRQFLVIGLILTAGMFFVVTFIIRRYVRKIANLERSVRTFAKTRDAAVAQEIHNNIRGGDEVDSLSEGVAQMIEEIRDYIANLVKTRRELDMANTNVARMSELAMKDALTNIRNRTAYAREVDRLGERLAMRDFDFAIAMIDLNNLKRINDTYGHEKGNVAIIRLSEMICDTFKHSMVFRIGGDEFAVILLNKDFRNRDALVIQMESALNALKQDETLTPWEQISAAIGLATYDPEKDTRIEDVFRRADTRMYENKKRMKAKT